MGEGENRRDAGGPHAAGTDPERESGQRQCRPVRRAIGAAELKSCACGEHRGHHGAELRHPHVGHDHQVVHDERKIGEGCKDDCRDGDEPKPGERLRPGRTDAAHGNQLGDQTVAEAVRHADPPPGDRARLRGLAPVFRATF